MVYFTRLSAYLGLESLAQMRGRISGAYSTLERRIQVSCRMGAGGDYPAKAEIEAVVDMDAPRWIGSRKSKGSATNCRVKEAASCWRVASVGADCRCRCGSVEKSSLCTHFGRRSFGEYQQVENSLLRVPHVFHPARGLTQTSCLDFGAQEQFDVLERAAKAHILTPESLPDEFGDARTDYRDVEKGNHLWLRGFGLQKRRPLPTKQLQKLLWNVHISRVMADAIVRFGQLRHTYVVVGWAPTANLEDLVSRLKEASVRF